MNIWELLSIGDRSRGETIAIWALVALFILAFLLAVIFSFTGGPNQFG